MLNNLDNEKGDTQYGFIALVLGIGAVISIIFFLQSCIKEYKDGKVIRRRQDYIDSHQPKKEIERSVSGTTVNY